MRKKINKGNGSLISIELKDVTERLKAKEPELREVINRMDNANKAGTIQRLKEERNDDRRRNS